MDKKLAKYLKDKDLVYFKDSDGIETWVDYDENKNVIHSKDSTGREFWREYDEYNKIHYKYSDGFEGWYKCKDGERIEITEKEYNFNSKGENNE